MSDTLMNKLKRRLVSLIDMNTVVVFFFAGHGVEYDGLQYLLPQDWDEGPRALWDEAMRLQQTLEEIEAKKPLVLLAFLDCCRQRVEAHRGGIFGAGGARQHGEAAGSLVMHATGQGKLAADGTRTGSGRNGVFTAALLKHFATLLGPRGIDRYRHQSPLLLNGAN